MVILTKYFLQCTADFLSHKTDKQLHDHPRVTKAAGKLFLSIVISNQLNVVPYLQHKPWQLLLREETMPAVRSPVNS